jgi:hypothetical protein
VVACRSKVSAIFFWVWQIKSNMLNRQVWSAAKSAAHLKQCMLYLVAYFMLQESKRMLISTLTSFTNAQQPLEPILM